MTKRFSRLKYALKTLQSPTGGSNNEPASGSILGKYKDFRDGKVKPSYTRQTESKPGELFERLLEPFGYPVTTKKTIVKASKRSVETATAGLLSACNLNANITGGADLDGFIPAKVTVFRKSSTQSSTKKNSQITGIAYDPTEGLSYTLPYGQTTAGVSESVVRANIKTAAGTLETVSFTSERL